MSLAYLKTFGNNVVSEEEKKNWNKKYSNIDENGKPVYITEQGHKKECDINYIIKKYEKTGLITHVANVQAMYGEMTGEEYKDIIDRVKNAERSFLELPSHIRNRFQNNPANLLDFIGNEENYDEAVQLGLAERRRPAEPIIEEPGETEEPA